MNMGRYKKALNKEQYWGDVAVVRLIENEMGSCFGHCEHESTCQVELLKFTTDIFIYSISRPEPSITDSLTYEHLRS